MGRERKYLKMEIFMLGVIKPGNLMEWEFILGRMERDMKESLSMGLVVKRHQLFKIYLWQKKKILFV